MENYLEQIVLKHSFSFANDTATVDKPLDLSLPKNQRYHGKENESSHVPIKGLKVTARLWQTTEVIRPEKSPEPFVSNDKPGAGETKGAPVITITSETLPIMIVQSNGNQEKDHGLMGSVSGDLGRGSQPPKKRNRFSITQLFLMEKVFEKKMFPSPSETQELAHLLDVEDCRVKAWFQSRRQKWKKENDWDKNIRMIAFAQQTGKRIRNIVADAIGEELRR